jgi:membrane-associated phospholipid phosphatase
MTSELDIFDKSSSSFPSRHAFLAGIGLYFLPKEFSKKIRKLYQIYFLLVVPLSLLISGVHFITDIIAGMAIGYILPYFLDKVFKK